MRILLLRPPYSRLRKTGQIPYFPLGIGYVGAVLEQGGFDVGIYNLENPTSNKEVIFRDERDVFNYRSIAHGSYMDAISNDSHFVWGEMRETLRTFKPDMVGISLLSVEYPSAVKISRICKEYNKDMKVIWGGFHPSFMPEGSLRNPEVDLVVTGEGEFNTLELCKAIKDGREDFRDIPGLYLRNPDGSSFYTGPQQLVKNLDELPFPARHLRLYPETYDPIFMANIVTSRGCPYRCSFCGCRNLWFKKFRRRSPANVVSEMKELTQRYNTNHVFFMDDTFSLDKKSAIDLCNRIIESDMTMVWTTGTRVDKVDDEIVSHMKDAGCVYIDLGIETGSERMSKIIKKDITNDQVLKAVDIINRHGIATGAFLMAGFLEETEADLEDTFNLIKKLKTTHIALNVWDPMPGSDLYDQAVSMGTISKDADWANFPLWPNRHYAVQMDPARFQAKCNEIAQWIFSYNNSYYNRYRKLRPKVLALFKRDPRFLVLRFFKHIKERLARIFFRHTIDK